MGKKRMALIIVLLWAFAWVLFADTARFGALVVDAESGIPLEGVPVEASFSNDNGWKAWTESAPINHDSEPTDRNGRCRLKGKTNIGRAGCWVDEPPHGYYGGGGRNFRFKWKSPIGIWQPENLVATIRLQRVEHPIPLFVKRVGDHINRSKIGHVDGTNTLFRYDLIAGDYLPPDGRGKVADLVVESRLTSLFSTNLYLQTMVFYDFTNTMSFPGEGNGVASLMTCATDGIKLRVAPEEDYERASVIRCGNRMKIMPPNIWDDVYTECNPNRCYYFRIRSRYDESGKLIGGYYGKIYGDFEIGCRLRYGGCSVEFLYYLNPMPLDRNLEWDMKNNFCPNPGNLGERRP